MLFRCFIIELGVGNRGLGCAKNEVEARSAWTQMKRKIQIHQERNDSKPLRSFTLRLRCACLKTHRPTGVGRRRDRRNEPLEEGRSSTGTFEISYPTKKGSSARVDRSRQP